jgi:hypothetical protein
MIASRGSQAGNPSSGLHGQAVAGSLAGPVGKLDSQCNISAYFVACFHNFMRD